MSELPQSLSPGGTLLAAQLNSNFTALADTVNAGGAERLRDGSLWSYSGLNVMATTPPWKEALRARVAAPPYTLSASGSLTEELVWDVATPPAFNVGPTGQPVIITARCTVSMASPGATACSLILALKAGPTPGSMVQVGEVLRWYNHGGAAAPNELSFGACLYHIMESTGAAVFPHGTINVGLYSLPEVVGVTPTLDWSLVNPQIEVLSVTA